MNLGDLKELARDLLGEKGDYWPDAQMNRLANMANRMVYRTVANADVSYFLEQQIITYPAETVSIDLGHASFLNLENNPYRVVDVAQLVSPGTISANNQPTSLEYLDPTEINNYHAAVHDPYVQQFSSLAAIRWTLENDGDLKLTPTPGAEFVLVVRYIQHPVDLGNDSDQLLHPDTAAAPPHTAIFAPEFHDLVLTVFCKILSTKERRSTPELTELHAFVADQIKQSELSRTSSHKINYESPY